MDPNTPPTPPGGAALGAYGKVTDSLTSAPVQGICVTLGQPGFVCDAITDGAGNYTIDASALAISSGGTWQLYFYTCPANVLSLDGHHCTDPTPGYAAQGTDRFVLSSVIRKDWRISK